MLSLTWLCCSVAEAEFLGTPASLVAGGSVCAAVAGMKLAGADQCVQQVAKCLRLELPALQHIMRRIEEMVQSEMANAQGNSINPAAKHAVAPGTKQSTVPAEEACCQPETPTDIQDVLF